MGGSATDPGSAGTEVSAPGAALGRQRWVRLIPIVFVTYSLAYLDRSNFSIASAGGMGSDLGVTGTTSALLAASFFLGYFLFQVPGVLYADRRSVRELIFWCVLAWGVLAALQGVLSSAAALIAVRFALGAVEAAVLPALVVFLARWFTRPERGRANAFLILGNPVTVLWLSAVSGYLVEFTSWRGMFVIEGVPAILWAFYFRWQVHDHPRQAPWLAEAECERVEAALAEEQAALTTDTEQQGQRSIAAYLATLRSRTVLLLAVQYLLWSIGVYGFVFWLPSIVKAGAATGIGTAGALSAIPYAVAVLAMVLNSRRSDRRGLRVRFVWPWLLLGGAAFYASYLLGAEHFWFSFVLLIVAGGAIYAPYGPFFALLSELLPRGTAALAVAVVNAFGALGGFAGTYLVGWLDDVTGASTTSFLLLACSMVAAALLTLGAAASNGARPRVAR